MKIFAFFTSLTFLICSFGCVSVISGSDCQISKKIYTGTNYKVDVSKYSENKDSQKSLLIVPPTGGTNYIDKSYASQFCSAGYDVYLLNSWTLASAPEDFDLDLHQRDYVRGQQAVSLVLNDIKTKFIGLLGTSLGALHGAVAASKQERLNAVFLIVGGAPIREVIVTSDQQAMQELFSQRQKNYGFKNTDEYLAALETHFLLEPMQLDDGFKTKDIGVSIALNDTTVPTLNQKKLAEYLKPKTVIEHSTSHFWGIFNTWLFSSQEIIDFFEASQKKQIHG